MFKNNATLKIIFIGVMTILLMIPLVMVRELIAEREMRYREAIDEVSSKWSSEQTIKGPLLAIPYTVSTTVAGERILRNEIAFFLPDKLNVSGDVLPETRSRGIFEVVLYTSQMQIDAEFSFPAMQKFQTVASQIQWENAKLLFGIPDLRGIQEDIKINWDGQEIALMPGVVQNPLFQSGVSAPISNLNQAEKERFQTSFSLSLQGSSRLAFVPFGKQTTVTLDSSWSSPSFDGSFLPSEREISHQGFKGVWDISYFGRSYPQEWSSESVSASLESEVEKSVFGVSLHLPVDYYQQNTRSVKYGILFIFLTFAAFFLFEVLSQLKIHPLQYLLVGFAMCIFYLLLLSLSEHIGFGPAYVISSSATVGLIGSYCFKVLKNPSGGILMTLLVAAIYSFLYVVLQLEDYALLIGSAAVFGALSIVMYLTRNIDWYSLRMEMPGREE